jgi:hypothetical protein
LHKQTFAGFMMGLLISLVTRTITALSQAKEGKIQQISTGVKMMTRTAGKFQ